MNPIKDFTFTQKTIPDHSYPDQCKFSRPSQDTFSTANRRYYSDKVGPAYRDISLHFSKTTPLIGGKNPWITVVFSQFEPNTWTDILFHKKDHTVPQLKLPLSNKMFSITELVFLSNSSTKKLKKLGSDEYEALLFHLIQGDHNGETASMMVDFQTKVHRRLYDIIDNFRLQASFKSVVNLSPQAPHYGVKLPGVPQQVILTNLKTRNMSLNVFWLHITERSSHFRSLIPRKVLSHCIANIMCSNYILLDENFFSKHKVHWRNWEKRILCQHAPGAPGGQILHITSCSQLDTRSVRAYTVHERYKYKTHYRAPVNTGICTTIVWCLNYSFPSNYFNMTQHYYFAFDMLFNFFEWSACVVESSKTQKSWIQASQMCTSHEAHLPLLRSKEEVQELTSLLKFDTKVPPAEVIFIGLLFGTKVSGVLSGVLMFCDKNENTDMDRQLWSTW